MACVRELPGLDELARRYEGRISVIAVMGWGGPAQARAVARAKSIEHLPLLDDGGRFAGEMGVDAVPTTFLVRKDGRVIGRLVGPASERFLAKQADQLLGGAPPGS
ncbi:MAG: TlpA family protein disulfide reductase [Deltaproteobacteria bacterium]